MYLKHFSYSLSTFYEDLLDVMWDSCRQWNVCITLTDPSSWGFKNLSLSQCQMVACFLQPNVQFWPYDRISKIQRIKTNLLGLALHILSMWVSYYSFPLSSLKHSCYWSIPQPCLCYNTMSKFDIFCFVSCFHNIVTLTNLCMLSKIACQWCICFIKEMINRSQRLAFACRLFFNIWIWVFMFIIDIASGHHWTVSSTAIIIFRLDDIPGVVWEGTSLVVIWIIHLFNWWLMVGFHGNFTVSFFLLYQRLAQLFSSCASGCHWTVSGTAIIIIRLNDIPGVVWEGMLLVVILIIHLFNQWLTVGFWGNSTVSCFFCCTGGLLSFSQAVMLLASLWSSLLVISFSDKLPYSALPFFLQLKWPNVGAQYYQGVKCKKTELCEIPMIGRIGIQISDD